ncbi:MULTISPECIES: crotonase/enoyl-CoA hydratase family protein [Williamsia]|jgi:enoyl-CoA hydratase/carnithine racemase|uniref:Short chain enoyl-CoA hydratase /enoyl-CoA hydratase n=1 Tax=Williamsia marianensis TaxID=85044 RepID=A0A495KA07_WILMA|nr:enoyl-CoA hydratase [Williamsia sp. D3]RKR97319.1 short chain enoyl-CoA hydratase /enoyl-CoA hydratase [Williamsia muralis]
MTNPNDVTGSHEVVVAHTEDSITTWTLNMPEARNPISGDEVVSRMVDLAAAANADRNVRVVILTGAGSAFSAGGNVKDMVDRVGMFGGNQADIQHGYTSGIQRLTRAIYGCEVPIIAAVNGPAVGAGCDLALMADMRIASEKAFFAESFVKLGLIPGDGGAWLLPRAVGAARAAEMAFTGDRVDAATALEWGLVSRVVAADALMDTAKQLAARVASNPPNALRLTKKLLREADTQHLGGILELSAAMQAISHGTADHREALSAFVERRPGQFTGD